MKSTVLTLGLVTVLSFSAWSQNTKKVDPDHTNFYKAATAEVKDVKIEITDGVSKIDYTKFKLKLSNTSKDYILYKPQESLFTIEDKTYQPHEKPFLIQPLDNGGKVIDIKGNGTNLHVDGYTYKVDGLYRVIPTQTPVTAPDFALPASVNQFTAGDFSIELVNISKKTQETSVKFKVTYTGDGMGLVDPKNLGVKLESGQTFANDKREKGFVLAKGESDTFSAVFHIEGKIADMQFANMQIVWNDTFKHAELKKIDGTTLNLVLDPGLTAGKNK